MPVGEQGPNGFDEPVECVPAVHRNGDNGVVVFERVGFVPFRYQSDSISFPHQIITQIAQTRQIPRCYRRVGED